MPLPTGRGMVAKGLARRDPAITAERPIARSSKGNYSEVSGALFRRLRPAWREDGRENMTNGGTLR